MTTDEKKHGYRPLEVTVLQQGQSFICSSTNMGGVIDETLSTEEEETF